MGPRDEIRPRLQAIADDLRKGEASPRPTVRELISWVGAKRRSSWRVRMLRRVLEEVGLATSPNFESAYIGTAIIFSLVTPKVWVPETGEMREVSVERPEIVEALPDPTYRLSMLAAANNVPVSVTPDESLSKAVTLMLANDFSQLPVMTSDREVKGVISWKSIGQRLGMGRTGTRVREFMDPPSEASCTTSLFEVLGAIAANDYVIVRGADKRVVGIVTASDVNEQFVQLTEPFLLIGEIENQIRQILGTRLREDDLNCGVEPADESRRVSTPDDLTLGESVRLLQNPTIWEKLGLRVDRVVVVGKLDRIREIRNDVMHFDPDGVPEEDLEVLRDTAAFLKKLREIRAS